MVSAVRSTYRERKPRHASDEVVPQEHPDGPQVDG